MCDLDPVATVYGFQISINTIYAVCNAKTLLKAMKLTQILTQIAKSADFGRT